MIRTQMGTHYRSENSHSAWDALYDTTTNSNRYEDIKVRFQVLTATSTEDVCLLGCCNDHPDDRGIKHL
jgi:hypothetical protein